MAEADLTALWLHDTENIAWLTAFEDVFDEERAHTLFVDADRAILHTDSRYATAARAAAEGTSIVVDDATLAGEQFVIGCLKDADATSASLTLGIEDTLTLAEFRRFERALRDAELADRCTIRETHDLGLGLRAVKDSAEIEKLKAAQAITDAAFEAIVDFIEVGMTEREIKRQLEDTMLRLGADGLAFPSIVATGPNGVSPHAIAGETRVEPGQCIVLDFGAVVDGYHADMTRTVAVGEPGEEVRRAWAAVRAANERVEASLRPGMTGKEAHELALSVLDEAGYGGLMGHGLGHGVGLQIHELPTLSSRNDTPLVPGNVVTVEPGIYVPGAFGMRLEDFGVITDTGFDRFTRASHALVLLS